MDEITQSTAGMPASGDASEPSQVRLKPIAQVCGQCNSVLLKNLLDGNFSPRTGVGFAKPRTITHMVLQRQPYRSFAKSGHGVAKALCGRLVTDVAPKASYEVAEW